MAKAASQAAETLGHLPPGSVSGQQLVDLLSNPASVAIVGASSDASKPAGRPLAYLLQHGYDGEIHLVNRHRDRIGDLPCASDVSELPPGIEAAMVNLPAAQVPEAVETLAVLGVKVAIVIGSGFEDREGDARLRLLAVLEDSELRLIGPNCVGVTVSRSAAHLTFSSVLQRERPRAGGVALVTQSGALGNGLLLSLLRRGAGVSHWFSTGNELNTGTLELVAGLLARPEVSAVGVFIEGVTDLAWLPAVREAVEAEGKTVYVVKAARTDLGRVAATGHTGRVVGAADISSAILSEAGLVELASIEQLADTLVYSDICAGRARGNRVGVVSVSGASAVLAADCVRQAEHLVLADLGAEHLEQLRAELDPRILPRIPLDVPLLGETDVFADTIEALADSESSDLILAVESGLAHDPEVLAERLVAREPNEVQLVVTYLSPDEPLDRDLVQRLAAAGVAVVPSPDRAIAAIDAATPSRGPSLEPASEPDPPVGPIFGLPQLCEMRSAAPLPWACWRPVGTLQEARAAADELGYPVVIKAAGRTVTHRSEIGAARTDIGADELDQAFSAIAAICADHNDTVIVQEQIFGGFEVLLACLRDPEFGLVALLRAGGTLAELLDEQVVLHSAWPVETRRRRLAESRIGALLGGYRGGERYDGDALLALVDDALAFLAVNRLDFLELNPVIVTTRGVTIVDALGSQQGGDASAD